MVYQANTLICYTSAMGITLWVTSYVRAHQPKKIVFDQEDENSSAHALWTGLKSKDRINQRSIRKQRQNNPYFKIRQILILLMRGRRGEKRGQGL